MTGWHDSGHDGAEQLTRRQLRERERLISGQEPDDGVDDPVPPGFDFGDSSADAAASADPQSNPSRDVSYEEFSSRLNPDNSMTRRELRALYLAQQHNEASGPDASGPAEHGSAEQGSAADGTGEQSVGHWSLPGDDDAVSTTSIVLPVAPNHNDMQQALNSTGEIILTGSIDLPRGMGATGAHPERYDSAEIDRLLDAADGINDGDPDIQPVSASSAVSTHSSASPLGQAPLRRRISVPAVLATTGGVLVIGVGTLLYFAFGIGF